jgi:nuclear pore complex protein Nup188
MQDFVNRPAAQALVPVGAASAQPASNPLDVRQGLITARRNLESIQLYSVTQLAMWLSKPEFAPGQEETDEAMDVQKPDSGPSGLNVSGSGSGLNFSTLKVDRRVTGSTPRSTSISMAERLRRGMTGDMASNLLAQLNKAKPLLAKSAEMVGKRDAVDITQVLVNFLQERIISKS